MLNTISYAEYIEWVAYYSIEPFPEERADFRNALIATILVNINSPKGSQKELKDFMFDFWGEINTKQSQNEIFRNATFLNAILNKKKKEGK